MPPKKTYYLAPTRDQPPTASGPIALGNLIKSPRKPEFPLNDPSSPAIAHLLRTRSAAVVTEHNAVRSLSHSRSLRPTVFASFLTGLFGGGHLGNTNPVTAGVEFDFTDTSFQTYRINKLETITINPSLEDISALFAEPAVQAALRDSRFTANLYLITGIQVAYGAEYLISRAKERGVTLHVAVDLTALLTGGVPVPVPGGVVGVGTGGEAVKETEGTAKGKVDGPFVFAYCVREVLYKRRKVTGQRRGKGAGDLYAVSGEDSLGQEKEKEKEAEFEAELAGVKEEDQDLPGYWDLAVESGLDLDGTECQIVRVDEDEGGLDEGDEEDEEED